MRKRDIKEGMKLIVVKVKGVSDDLPDGFIKMFNGKTVKVIGASNDNNLITVKLGKKIG